MSIYCSRLSMGSSWPDDTLPPPIAYLGSHVRILPDAWRYGTVHTAHIPPWCAHDVTDPESVDEDGPPVPYLRLSVDGYNWRDPEADASADVVLDAEQVAALRDDLTRWLEAVAGLPPEVSALLEGEVADVQP